MIDKLRAELQKYHSCYHGCHYYTVGGEKMHHAAAAIERTLDIAEALLKGDAKDQHLADSLITAVASALRLL